MRRIPPNVGQTPRSVCGRAAGGDLHLCLAHHHLRKTIQHNLKNEFLIVWCVQGGVYLVNMLNTYGPGLAILFVVFVESAGVCWIYGTDNFARDIEKMIGKRPGLFWRICWKYISPVFLLVGVLLKFLTVVRNDFFRLFLCVHC